MDCSLPGSSVHGDSPGKNIGGGNHSLLHGIFPTPGSNPGLLHCRQIVYHLSHQGSPSQEQTQVYIIACSYYQSFYQYSHCHFFHYTLENNFASIYSFWLKHMLYNHRNWELKTTSKCWRKTHIILYLPRLSVLFRGQHNLVLNQLIWSWNLRNFMICGLQARDPGKPATGYERPENQGAGGVGSSLSLKVWEPAARRAKNWCPSSAAQLESQFLLPFLFYSALQGLDDTDPQQRQQCALVSLPI